VEVSCPDYLQLISIAGCNSDRLALRNSRGIVLESVQSPKELRPVSKSIVDVTRMLGIAQAVRVLSEIRIFRCAPAAGNDTIAARRFDPDRHTMAGGNGIAGDRQIITGAGFQPPILRRNMDGGHPAVFHPVAWDLAADGLDENAARTVEAEVADVHRRAVADALGGTNAAAKR
jgi:hypothetical protein